LRIGFPGADFFADVVAFVQSRRCKFSDVEGVKLESIMLVKLLCALHCTGKLARKASKERKNKVLKVRGKAKTEVRSGKAVAKKKKD